MAISLADGTHYHLNRRNIGRLTFEHFGWRKEIRCDVGGDSAALRAGVVSPDKAGAIAILIPEGGHWLRYHCALQSTRWLSNTQDTRSIVDDPAFDQRPTRFTNPLNADRLHSKALCSLDIDNVVIEKKHLRRTAAERLRQSMMSSAD
jgi:hypothetical protein